MRKHWDNVLIALYMMIGVLGCIILFGLPFAAAQQPSRVERIEQGIQEIREAQTANLIPLGLRITGMLVKMRALSA